MNKTTFLFTLLASTAYSFTHWTHTNSFRTIAQLNLKKSVDEAIAEAQMICANDPSSYACRVAWDIVEELEAADSHRNSQQPDIIDNGGANIDVLLQSFDILVKKVDGKMDQLKATTEKMQELGATDPSIAELGYLAEDMKAQMAYVRGLLNQY